MKKVLVLAVATLFIGSGMISLAQEPVKKPETEKSEPADTTKQEALVLPPDTVPAATLTADII